MNVWAVGLMLEKGEAEGMGMLGFVVDGGAVVADREQTNDSEVVTVSVVVAVGVGGTCIEYGSADGGQRLGRKSSGI